MSADVWSAKALVLTSLLVMFALTTPPFVRIASAGQSIDDVDRVPFVDERGQRAWAKFRGFDRHKAFAISPSGAWAWQHRWRRQEAEQRAINTCNRNSESPCRLFAVNEDVVWVPHPDDEALARQSKTHWTPSTKEQAATAVVGYKIGQRFPDITLESTDGRKFMLSDLRGKVTFLNFTASWCPPCIAELPGLLELQESLSGEPNIEMIAIPTGRGRGGTQHWLETSGLNMEICETDLSGRWLKPKSGPGRRIGLPLKFVIDPNGIVQSYGKGSGRSWSSYADDIRALLSGPSS